MALPVEIKLRIFQEVVDTLPWEEVWRARLVSTFFEHEFTKLIIRSPRFELEGLGFEPPCGISHGHINKNYRWNHSPTRFQHMYLHQKIQMHSRNPCVFSTFVQGILDLPNERTSAEETHTLTNKLIDAWMCDKIRPMQPFFDTTDYQVHMKWAIDGLHGDDIEWEPLQETLNLALATSAIKRNDCAELRILLSQGVNLAQESVRFGILPLSEAAEVGSNEVTEIIVANNYPVIYGGITELYEPFNALYMHMMRGNKEGVQIWCDHLRSTGQDISEYLHPLSTVGFSDTEMVLFLDEEFGDELGGPLFRRKLFAAAVYNKEVETMQRLFARGGVDINRMEGEKNKSPLDAVLELQLPHRGKGITHEMESSNLVVKFLLENGANPDGCVAPVGVYTPFVEAVATENIPAATMLLEYGATVDEDRILSLMINETDADWTDLLRLMNIT